MSNPLKGVSQHSQKELLELQRELASRQLEAVRLYRPNKNQEEIHTCPAKEIVILGGNRCLSGDQELYDPVLDRTLRVDAIDSDFHVLSWDGSDVVVKAACRPFVKGFGDLYAVTLSNGQEIRTTLQHRVYCGERGWLSVSDAHSQALPLFPQPTIEGTCLAESRLGGRGCSGKAQGCLGGYSQGQRPNESCCASPWEPPTGGNEVYITALRLIGQGKIWDITVEDTECYFAGGVLHHNSGKTTAALVELSWALTGAHPVEGRYPKENGVAIVVGAGWRHIGMTIYPGLFKAGKFDIIRDEATGEWRAFDPVKDADRAGEKKPAPPLIPPRMIKSMSWVLKSAGYLQSCELVNGWTLYCLSSEGEPPQGFRADLCLFDEDLTSESTWLAEMQARLADRRGRFIWSATPHSRNDALFGLCERADKAAEQGQENPKKFTLRFLDNNFIPEESRKLLIEQWASQGSEVLRMRAEGEFTYDSILMYPNFLMGVHGYRRSDLPDGVIPADWCRYAAIDPGHAICAVLFAAIPPSGDMVLLYDEIYLPNANAVLFAEKFHSKVAGQPQFYAFLIDSHGARLTDIGGGKSPGQQYSEQLELLGVRSKATGSSFMHGSDDVMAGIESVRNAMHIRPNGTPRLRILEGALPNFQREIARYKRQSTVVGGQTIITDKPHPRSVSHLMDCMRYLLAADIRYHKPEQVSDKPWWWDMVQKRRRQRGQQDGVVYLAPNTYATEIYVA